MRKDIWRSLVFWTAKTEPNTTSCLKRLMLVEGSIDDDFEDSAEVYDDFNRIAAFQA